MTKEERTQMYVAFLEEEGYHPKVDDDGDVIFKHEGKSYIVLIDEDDEVFFRLVYPNFWGFESESELVEIKEAALRASAQTKVAKVFTVGDNVWGTVELFCSPPDAFQPVFGRCLSALQASVKNFVSLMAEAPSLQTITSRED